MDVQYCTSILFCSNLTHMNKKIITSIAIAIIGISLYFWWFSDSKVVIRKTESLVGYFEKNEESGRIGGAITTTGFKDLLADNAHFKLVNINLPYASTFQNTIDKDFMVTAHAHLVNSAGIVTITNKKITLVEINNDTAKVDLNFHIKTEKIHTNFDHNLSCKLTYKKIDDRWKLSIAEVK